MREFLKASIRRVASGWFWPLVLLALPNCMLDRTGLGGGTHLVLGGAPHSSAIMCDIERYQATRRCATSPTDLAGVRLAAGAEALVSGQSSNVGLDFSPDAEAVCGAGVPQAIDFQGAFPDGFVVCLNCGDVIPVPHADATAVCVAQCRDLIDQGMAPAPPDPLAFCTDHAHPSTLFPISGCFDSACSGDGTLRADFADPRRMPEPVAWTDRIGTSAVGPNLTRDAAPTGNFDAGAVSTQWITSKDGYVEFEASENNLSHVIGFAQLNGCPFPCHDSDTGIMTINFAISLNVDGRFYVLENGNLVPGPDINQSFGTYNAGDRFRLKLKDNFDGTATVSYFTIAGACVPGNPCLEVPFPDPVPPHVPPPATYPLRVDTSFREQNATLANVNFVRIQ